MYLMRTRSKSDTWTRDGLITVTTPDEKYPDALSMGAGIVSGLLLGFAIRMSLNNNSLDISPALAAVLVLIVIASVLGLVVQDKQFGNKTMGILSFILGLLLMFGLTVLGTTSAGQVGSALL